jgi:hypothetical protein
LARPANNKPEAGVSAPLAPQRQLEKGRIGKPSQNELGQIKLRGMAARQAPGSNPVIGSKGISWGGDIHGQQRRQS